MPQIPHMILDYSPDLWEPDPLFADNTGSDSKVMSLSRTCWLTALLLEKIAVSPLLFSMISQRVVSSAHDTIGRPLISA
jgi:hypothetical protein